MVEEFDTYYNYERVHQALNNKTPMEAWEATESAPPPAPEPRMPNMPPSAQKQAEHAEAGSRAETAPHPNTRAPLALHPSVGSADLMVKRNGQVKALSSMFYVATSRAAETVHVIWNETVVEIFTDDGEHIITYPRPVRTGMYYGPRTSEGTLMKTAGKISRQGSPAQQSG